MGFTAQAQSYSQSAPETESHSDEKCPAANNAAETHIHK